MKIGVIADTHIPEAAKEIPSKILEDFKAVDMIIHAGDLVSFSVIRQLETSCKNVNAVWGNMDPQDLRKRLAQTLLLDIKGFKVGVMHGHGHPANLISLISKTFENDFVDLIIFGHSHVSFNQEEKGILFFNPGSPTDKVFSPYNSYGIITVTDNIEAKVIKL